MTGDPFEGAPISRRQFVRLSAATGVALALPGQSASGLESDAFDGSYEYVSNHSSDVHQVPTLVEMTTPATLSTVESVTTDAPPRGNRGRGHTHD